MNAVNKIEQHNPIGTDGFEFVEFTAPNAEGIEQLRTLLTLTPSGTRYAPLCSVLREKHSGHATSSGPCTPPGDAPRSVNETGRGHRRAGRSPHHRQRNP